MPLHTDNVAILLAAYNGEKFIEQQLDSIVNQTCSDWELFIHDDGSCDSTPAILKKYAAAFPDRIHLIEAAPRGSARSNFLFLMSQVDAPYVMFCDQDDVWNEDKIECSLSAIRRLESSNGKDVPLLVFSDATVVDCRLNIIADSFFSYQHLNPDRLRFSELLVQNTVPGNTSMFNRALLQHALRYSDENAIIIHDCWCALIASYFGAIGAIKKSTLLYRQHNENSMGAIKSSGLKYILSMLKKTDVIRASIIATRVQAGEFAKAFRLGSDSLPARYAAAGEMNKLQRLKFYGKNRIRRSGFYRRTGFYFFG